ncbi:hypothetical protein BJV78DRAFT_1153908 [Lactifluus subvellereus]|nr:hypothetical protein BJV78DRAFT_1153908 [Lactifluus subvellereus]
MLLTTISGYLGRQCHGKLAGTGKSRMEDELAKKAITCYIGAAEGHPEREPLYEKVSVLLSFNNGGTQERLAASFRDRMTQCQNFKEANAYRKWSVKNVVARVKELVKGRPDGNYWGMLSAEDALMHFLDEHKALCAEKRPLVVLAFDESHDLRDFQIPSTARKFHLFFPRSNRTLQLDHKSLP